MNIKSLIISTIIFISFNLNSFSQDNLYLQLIPVDSAGINLLKIAKTEFIFKDSTKLFNFIESYKKSYSENGYISFSADSIIKKDSLYLAYLFFGLKFELTKLQFKNIDSDAVRFIKQSKKKNKSLNINNLNGIKQKIAIYYENNGFPFVQVKFDSIAFIDDKISGIIEAIPYDKFYIDSLMIKGNPKISNKFLLNYISVKKGDIYNQEKINKIETDLKKLKFINQVKPTEIEFRKSEADIYLYLANKKSNFFSGIIGFANDEKDESNFKINGDVNLILNNSFKIGEKLEIYWIKFNENSQNLDFSINFPYLFILPIGIETSFNLEKNELNYLTTNFKSSVAFNFSNNNIIKSYYARIQSFIINKDSIDINIINGFDSYSLGISFEIDKTDNIKNPLKGYSFLFSSGFGYRSDSEIQNNNFIEFEFKASYYFKILEIFTLGFKNSSAGLINDSGFYENEIYKIGGLKSLKGFDEKQIPATLYSIFTIEPKISIGYNSSIFIIANFAYYETKNLSTTISDTPYGFGAGLNFDTKAGIFTLIYALGSQKDNPIKFSLSKVHFGFLARF
ncbi:MAG: hypothetical protein JXR51_04505 [Bacteroidales bacterium]|nr:hypothetical protein [Bacteroidales bacterium]